MIAYGNFNKLEINKNKVIPMKTWNRERKKTRDRLLDYDASIMPIMPSTASLPYIYPWENITLSILSNQIFKVAQLNGYTGS